MSYAMAPGSRGKLPVDAAKAYYAEPDSGPTRQERQEAERAKRAAAGLPEKLTKPQQRARGVDPGAPGPVTRVDARQDVAGAIDAILKGCRVIACADGQLAAAVRNAVRMAVSAGRLGTDIVSQIELRTDEPAPIAPTPVPETPSDLAPNGFVDQDTFGQLPPDAADGAIVPPVSVQLDGVHKDPFAGLATDAAPEATSGTE